MNKKSINYLNTLTEYPFLKAHQEIYGYVQQISNPRIAGVVACYADCLKDLGQIVPDRPALPLHKLHKARIEAYNNCHKALESLKGFVSHSENPWFEPLDNAFRRSLYRVQVSLARSILDNAFAVASSVPWNEKDLFSLNSRMEQFIALSRDCHQWERFNVEAKRVRKSKNHMAARRNCVVVYRCILELAKNYSVQGDKECSEFLSWLKTASHTTDECTGRS